MSEKHTTTEYQRNSKHLRKRVRASWDNGDDVACWRCGRLIFETTPFDIGHLDPFGGEGLDNLAPEHRSKTGVCPGNRNLGGRAGARITNAGKKPRSTFKGLPWA